jgi:hypothetical protein
MLERMDCKEPGLFLWIKLQQAMRKKASQQRRRVINPPRVIHCSPHLNINFNRTLKSQDADEDCFDTNEYQPKNNLLFWQTSLVTMITGGETPPQTTHKR